MAHNPNLPDAAASRAEKMSVLSALLGPEALAKLREGQPEVPAAEGEIDADRAAWHRNKLLERLRRQSVDPRKAVAQNAPSRPVQAPVAPDTAPRVTSENPALGRTVSLGSRGLDSRLAAIADPATLDQEHPAVIARLMRGLSREERVTAIRSLPGPIARSIVRRLR